MQSIIWIHSAWCIPLLSIHSTPSDRTKDVGTVSVVMCIRYDQCEHIKKTLLWHKKMSLLAWYPEDFYFKIMNLEWFSMSFVSSSCFFFNTNSTCVFECFTLTASTRNIFLFVSLFFIYKNESFHAIAGFNKLWLFGALHCLM